MQTDNDVYDLIVEEDVPVRMRDGVKLSADIYAPSRNGQRLPGPWPALLGRTPYGKRGEPGRSNAAFFARQGYLVVMQDCRGRHGSEGRFFPFVDEPADGFDTVAWLSRHPLCDGQVGTYGGSHMAWVQFHMATQAPPALKTMVPHFGPVNAFHYSMREGGALQLWWLNWILRLAARGSRQAGAEPYLTDMLLAQPMLQWMARLPWQAGQSPLKHVPEYEQAALRFMQEDNYGEFWRQPGLAMDEHFASFPDIPILWIGGWYDYYPRAICEGFARYTAMGRKNQYLLMGPWTHAGLKDAAGDVYFGPQAAMQMRDVQLKWFDHWLKGRGRTPFAGSVRFFVMGAGDRRREGPLRTVAGQLNHGGEWIETNSWPPRGTQASFYLVPGGRLTPQPPPEPEAFTSYSYDPRDPVPSVGWCYVQDWDGQPAPVGPRDLIQPALLLGLGKAGMPLASRRDVLVFQSDPLDSDLTVAGPVDASLWVCSDCCDTDFTARLSDVYPPSAQYPCGYAMPVAEGILRARFRECMSNPRPLPPGRPVEIRIVLSPTANCFRAGHRLRVDVSSSNFPRFEANRNAWTPEGGGSADRSVRIASNRVYHDAAHPSRINLLILPPGANPGDTGA